LSGASCVTLAARQIVHPTGAFSSGGVPCPSVLPDHRFTLRGEQKPCSAPATVAMRRA
jgi:hypothetical protein